MTAPHPSPAAPLRARPQSGQRVLLALSGGVDSAVCVQLLRRQGLEVEGAFIRFSPAHAAAEETACRAAREMEIPLHLIPAQGLFARQVIGPFCQAYAAGLTPNPCVVCNPTVKLHLLARLADRLGIHLLATGHYARLVEENGTLYLARAKSAARDQSYVLYRLSGPILQRLLLPAGELEKQEIRAIAQGLGLSAANSPDSQEICFIPDGDYPAYIERRGQAGKLGRIIGPGGQDLGPHPGVHRYTVGQRRGLGVALGRPVFVRAISPKGDIHLAFAEDATIPGIEVADLVMAGGLLPDPGAPYTVKVRSMGAPVPCRAQPLPGGRLYIRFATPQRVAAPGQHAVLYQGALVAGGGVIQPPAHPE